MSHAPVRVLLTGATGFIGSAVARLLVRDGANVHALVRPGSDTWRLAEVLPSLRVSAVNLRAGEPGSTELRDIVREAPPDICLHLAWFATPAEYVDSPQNLDMVAASLVLARAVADAGCPRLLVAGTCAEYDTDAGRLSEDHRLRPRSVYAASKAGLYTVLDRFSERAGMRLVWPRLFYQYGPFEHQRRLVPSVITALLNGTPAETTPGDQVRDYLHVDDVAAAIWAAARADITGPVNVGSGSPIAIRDLVLTIGELIGRPELVKLGARAPAEDEPTAVYADNARLLSDTDWRPRYELTAGLQETIDWWEAQMQRPRGSDLAAKTKQYG